jgi:hypothetical protein
MSTENIKPDKITKPIQLLAAWLLGLILINASFLTAASQIHKPEWAASMLVIATVANVPLFLISLFLLQTKFRPEMQEDTFYSKYLERKYSTTPTIPQLKKLLADEEKDIKTTAELITKETGTKNKEIEIETILKNRDKVRIQRRVGESRAFSELFLKPQNWERVIEKWGKSHEFKRDIEELYFYKVIEGDLNDPLNLKLTDTGKEIAEKQSNAGLLWNQTHPERDL